MRAHRQIAIDGPAGVGKSTIGERVARRLGMVYVDTGAFYRALTLAALHEHVDPDDAPALTALARRTQILLTRPTIADGRQYTVLVNGNDVTPQLRTPTVEMNVSRVARHPEVRHALIEHMREMAESVSVVMVGRDIGSVVLPDADLKIRLMTSIDQRAQRRFHDLLAQYGPDAPTFEEVRDDIQRRDANDADQMQYVPDAIALHNDDLEPDETVALILGYLHPSAPAPVTDPSDGAIQQKQPAQ